jgi:hypothetical protein
MWLTPQDAIARFERGELPMLPPTITTLRDLAAFSTAAEALASASSRDIAPVLPRVVIDGDQMELLLPHEKGYDS